MPQWLADALQNAAPGAEIGYSHDVSSIFPNESNAPANNDLRLVLSHQSIDGSEKPSEYGISLPNTSQNLWVFTGREGGRTEGEKAIGTVHMIPKRDEKYAALLKERLSRADITVQHRTQHDETSHDTLRGSVHLFQRPTETDVNQPPESRFLVASGSPDSQASSSRMSKRMKSLDEMPQNEIRKSMNTSNPPKSVDEALMSILVNQDKGWPLQQLSKAVKEVAGVSTPMAQLKAKMLEICVYQRRGEDTHPKYYLKNEFK